MQSKNENCKKFLKGESIKRILTAKVKALYCGLVIYGLLSLDQRSCKMFHGLGLHLVLVQLDRAGEENV